VPTGDIVELLRACMGDGERRSVEFWRWKHEDNPFGRSPGVAAYVGEALAGIRVMLRWEWLSGGETLHAVRAVDTATHPDWRRLGLFRKMTLALLDQLKNEGVDFVFNTPNPKSEAGYLTMGWQALGRVPMLGHPAPPWRWPASASEHAPQEDPHAPVDPSVAELLNATRLERFLSRLGADDGRLQTPRSIPFLQWRYLRPPGMSYGARWSIDPGGSGAAVVFRTRARGRWRELLLSEVLVSPDPAGAGAAASVLRELRKLRNHHYIVAHAAAATPERAALTRAGFIVIPRSGPRMTVRPMNSEATAPDPVAPGSWRLALGDLEVF
jgi:GNAT superfamily N-acetyltransferase